VNWEAIGAIGEVAGAIGVILTLGYLAVQIRANTAALKAEGSRANRVSGAPISVAIAQSSETARIFNSGLADFDSLTPEEQTRFSFLLGDMIGNTANRYAEVELGILSETEFAEDTLRIAPLLKAPGGRAFWKRFSGWFPSNFREYVTKQILGG